MKKDFKEKLNYAIKDAGNELVKMADDITNDCGENLLSKLEINIIFDPKEFTMEIPTIEVIKEYLCKTAIDRNNKKLK